MNDPQIPDASLAADLEAAANELEGYSYETSGKPAENTRNLAARLRAHAKRIGGSTK